MMYDACCGIVQTEANKTVNIFNIGSDDMISVTRIAEIVCEELHTTPNFKFTGGKRGWKGDVPVMSLDASRLNKLGWKQRYNSEGAVRKATKDLLAVLGTITKSK
uniref:GDP-L-fucose synthase n=1 Tax=Candidatus Methanophaga sp. ANME-1 ERB7 TaxID=2759913 RepID=A0A7G9Z6V2_9EURY|nr:hypothetical protein DPHACCJJ_00001 [Methanosarcinales archaeon ANME-1 ERB7]